MIRISVAKDYTTIPAGNFKKNGTLSGEEFRLKFLVPAMEKSAGKIPILVDLDGTKGYGWGWLRVAFGGLVHTYGKELVKATLILASKEEPYLIQDVEKIIEDAVPHNSK